MTLSAFICSIGMLTAGLNAGQYSGVHYTVNENLPSNFVKCVALDQDGFLWSGTDAGLARFDGRQFETFNENLPSLKVKALLNTPEFGLLVLTDMGLCQVVREGLQPITKLLIPGSTETESGKLHFAKSLYRDSNGVLWMGEADGMVSWKAGSLKRYPVDRRFFNDSFSRAFTFLESDSGELFAVSWGGQLFRFDRKGDQFIHIPVETGELVRRGYAAIRKPGDRIWFGTRSGIFECNLNNPAGTIRRVLHAESVHSMSLTDDGNVFYGTISNGLWVVRPGNQAPSPVKIPGISDIVVNQIITDQTGNSWIAQDEGIHLLYTNQFLTLIPAVPGRTMRTLVRNPDSSHLIVSFDRIIHYQQPFNPTKAETLLTSKRDLFDAVFSENKLWISYRDGELISYPMKGLIPDLKRGTVSLAAWRQSRLWLLTMDVEGNLWGFDERNQQAYCQPREGNGFFLGPMEGIISPIHKIRSMNDGSVYFGGTGSDSYLFIRRPGEKTVSNISKTFPAILNSQPEVYDVIPVHADSILLGTNMGLYAQTRRGIHRIFPYDPKENLVIRGMDRRPDGTVFLGTERGVWQWTGNEWISFNSTTGLPAIPMVNHGIRLLSDNALAILTTRNAVFSTLGASLKQSISPVFRSVEASRFGNDLIHAEEPIDVQFIVPVYPHVPVINQYRIGSGSWMPVTTGYHLFLNKLEEGKHLISLRSQQPGRLWSEARQLTITTHLPWYKSVLFGLIMICLAVAGIVFVIQYLARRRVLALRLAQTELEAQIGARTAELLEKNRHAREMNAELIQANRVKADLLAIASHELKNPLTAVIGYTEILRKAVKEKSNLHRLGEIQVAATRMLRVINSLLETAALESGKRQLNLSVFSVGECLSDIARQNEIASQKKGQTVTITLESDFSIQADKHAVEEILDNLLSNAIKYSPKQAVIEITCYRSDKEAVFEVTDQGPGISVENQERLFRRYEKAGSIPTGGEFSTGLGLSIAQELAVLHGGRIDVQSQQGSGSTFSLYLPTRL